MNDNELVLDNDEARKAMNMVHEALYMAGVADYTCIDDIDANENWFELDINVRVLGRRSKEFKLFVADVVQHCTLDFKNNKDTAYTNLGICKNDVELAQGIQLIANRIVNAF